MRIYNSIDESKKHHDGFEKKNVSSAPRSPMLLAAFAGVLACIAEQADASDPKIDVLWGCSDSPNNDC